MRWPHLDFLMSNRRDEDHVVIFWQICLYRNLIKYGSMKNAWAKHVIFFVNGMVSPHTSVRNTVEWDIFFCRDSTTLWRRRNYAISLQLVTGTVLAYIFVIQSLQVEKKKRIEKVFRLIVSHKQFWLQKFVSLKKKQISNIFDNFFILSYFDNLSFFYWPAG